MTIWRLIRGEIAYRKTNFLLSMLAVLVAVGSVVAAISLLDRYGLRSAARAKEQKVELQTAMDAHKVELRTAMVAYEDSVRKNMLDSASTC